MTPLPAGHARPMGCQAWPIPAAPRHRASAPRRPITAAGRFAAQSDDARPMMMRGSTGSASLQQALELFRGFGHRLGEAQTLTSLGDLTARTGRTRQAREHYTQALAIGRDIGLPLEEASALEGLGRACLDEGAPQEGATLLRQALAIYQRIGAPGARRAEEALRHHPRATSGTS